LVHCTGRPKKVVHFSTHHIFGTVEDGVDFSRNSRNILVKSVSFYLEWVQEIWCVEKLKTFLGYPVHREVLGFVVHKLVSGLDVTMMSIGWSSSSHAHS